MYYNSEQLENDLSNDGYVKLERKPWNVREGDVIVLEQYGMGFMNSGWMPVIVNILDQHKDFNNPHPYDRSQVSRKRFIFWHKAMHESDRHRIYGWPNTYWWSRDTVEIWRKK